MEFYEYLRKCGFKIDSSSKDIKAASEKLLKEPNNFRKILGKLKWHIEKDGDVADNWDAAESWLEKHKDEVQKDINYVYDETNTGDIAKLLAKIAEEKEGTKQRIRTETAAAAPVTADYTIVGLTKAKETVDLFNAVISINHNEHDKKLLKCFAILGDAVVYRASGKCYRLMTRTSNGRPMIVFAAGDSGEEGVLGDIINSMTITYEKYMRKLHERISGLPEYPENEEQHPIEDIFLQEVPTVFRHIVEIRKTYKTSVGEDGKDHKYFNCYRVYAKKSAVTELTCAAFVEWLSANWIRATRGILDRSACYKVFSNDPSEMAVSRFVIWPKADWENAQIPASWDEIFGAKASPRLLERLYFFTGSLLDASNSAQQYLSISDPGQTGKSTYLSLVETCINNITHNEMSVHINNSVLKDGDQFGLSSVHIWNYRWGIVNEYDGRSLNSSNSKGIVGGDDMTLQMKNMDAVKWDTRQFRLVAPSNNGFVLKSHAVRRRCIPLTFKATHSSIDNLNDEDKQKLIDDGEAFLKFCWKVYQTSKFRQRDGGYFVCCPEDEQLFLEGKFFVPSGEVNPHTNKPILKPVHDDKSRLLRAFSHDPEISSFYTVDDYEDTEITEGFNQFIGRYCDESEDDNPDYLMHVKDFVELVTTYAIVDKTLYETFGDALQTKGGRKSYTTIFNFRSSDYKMFRKFMENHGHSVTHDREGNAFTRVRIKPAYIKDDGTILKPKNVLGSAQQFNPSDIEEDPLGLF